MLVINLKIDKRLNWLKSSFQILEKHDHSKVAYFRKECFKKCTYY